MHSTATLVDDEPPKPTIPFPFWADATNFQLGHIHIEHFDVSLTLAAYGSAWDQVGSRCSMPLIKENHLLGHPTNRRATPWKLPRCIARMGEAPR